MACPNAGKQIRRKYITTSAMHLFFRSLLHFVFRKFDKITNDENKFRTVSTHKNIENARNFSNVFSGNLASVSQLMPPISYCVHCTVDYFIFYVVEKK